MKKINQLTQALRYIGTAILCFVFNTAVLAKTQLDGLKNKFKVRKFSLFINCPQQKKTVVQKISIVGKHLIWEPLKPVKTH